MPQKGGSHLPTSGDGRDNTVRRGCPAPCTGDGNSCAASPSISPPTPSEQRGGRAALDRIGSALKPRDSVLVRTGGDRLLHTRGYYTHGAGVSATATRWLLDQGVKLVGIDAWGWDVALPVQAQQAKASGRRDIFWAYSR